MKREKIIDLAKKHGIRVRESFIFGDRANVRYSLPAEIEAFAAAIRSATKEEDARIWEEQAKEPECPERSQYCAEAIRASK